jgi:hypothetical protein
VYARVYKRLCLYCASKKSLIAGPQSKWRRGENRVDGHVGKTKGESVCRLRKKIDRLFYSTHSLLLKVPVEAFFFFVLEPNSHIGALWGSSMKML